MNNRILILSVSRKVSLIKAFKEAGWHVTGQDLDPNSVALKFCDAIAPPDKENGPFDMILPTRDAELKSGTHRCSDETIDICTDKVRFSEWCEANGFLSPKILYTEHTKERGVIGAAFVKPRFSSSQNKTEGFVECVYSEAIIGLKEYSIDIFNLFDGTPINIVPRSRDKVLMGESWISTTVEAPILIEEAIRLSKTLGLISHSVIQCFWDGVNRPIIIECNARFGGQSNFAIKSGCNSPLYMLDLINGKEVKPEIGNYKRNLKVYSYREDLIEES